MQNQFLGYMQSDTRIDYSKPLEVLEVPLWWQSKGLLYTSTGYGSKIPTEYKIKVNNRFYRVYCRIYSNSGSLYIIKNKQKLFVDITKV